MLFGAGRRSLIGKVVEGKVGIRRGKGDKSGKDG